MPLPRRLMLGLLTGAGAALLKPTALFSLLPKFSIGSRLPIDIARDEQFWLSVRQMFDIDESIVNLNNGGVSPSPSWVLDSAFRAMKTANGAPSYTLWRHQEPGVEITRRDIANMFGVSPEEIALTRNASEALETVQLGLPLLRGDEIITTSQDYPRMTTTWEQRVRRDGVVLRVVDYPTPLIHDADILAAIEKEITPRTKVIHVSHVVFMTGQILPVKEIAELARSRGIISIVDGAHAFAQFPFQYSDVGCDYYATSLHKWLCAPIGCGFLFAKREQIATVWPLMAAPKEMDNDIRKFEEIGTHPAALHAAVSAAVSFNNSLGVDRKAARLRHLHSIWIQKLKQYSTVKFHMNTDNANSWCGIATVSVENTDLNKLQNYLLEKHRIFTVGITHKQFQCLRITPNIYTRAADMEYFGEIMAKVARHEIPETM